jgi:hypothetical protein
MASTSLIGVLEKHRHRRSQRVPWHQPNRAGDHVRLPLHEKFTPTASFFFCLFYRYAFDIDAKTQSFLNRRVLAYIDTGGPDGLQVDTLGNVYAGCGDGVHVRIPLRSSCKD